MINLDSSETKSEFFIQFNQLLNEIEQQLSDEECELINPSDLRRVANYIDGLKPLSKMRVHKKNLITYLERIIRLIDSNEFNKTYTLLSSVGTLTSVLHYLNYKYDFSVGNASIHSLALIGLIIDVIFAAIGLAKFYYFIPIMTLIYLYKGIKKQKILEAEGKILNL